MSSPGTGDASSPQVAAGGNGGFTVVWDRATGAPNTYFVQANTRAANGFWAGVTDLSVASLYSPIPDVAMDAAGNATAIWKRYDGVSFYLRASQRTAGGAWTPPVDVSAATQVFNGTAMVMDAAGTTRLAWATFEGGHYVVRTVGSAFLGPWSAPAPRSNPAQNTFRLAMAVDPVGNAVLTWQRAPSPGTGIVEALGLDGAGPTVSAFSAPPTALQGTTLTYAANATDAWSAVTGYSWSFGDGASAAGPIVSHTYAAPGSFPVTLTVTDAVGNTTTRSATTSVAAVPAPVPAITTFKLKNKTIATDEKTKLTVRLNTASTLKLVFKSKHKHLVKGKKKYLKVVVRKRLPAGLSKVTVKGKKLEPDTWKVTGTATNTAGTSARKKTKLVVVKP